MRSLIMEVVNGEKHQFFGEENPLLKLTQQLKECTSFKAKALN